MTKGDMWDIAKDAFSDVLSANIHEWIPQMVNFVHQLQVDITTNGVRFSMGV